MNNFDADKISNNQYKVGILELEGMILKVHSVMDYFSNEFLRIENFIEKYMPLKIQNQISVTL